MNLSPSTLLVIVVVTAVVNVLIVLALVARSRSDRARHVIEVDGLMSSSYADPTPADTWPDSGPVARWADARGDWPLAGFGASAASAASRRRGVDPVEVPGVEPFEYPAPTSLEQRSLDLEAAAEASDWAEDRSLDPAGSDEDDDEAAEDDGAEDDAEDEVEYEDGDEDEIVDGDEDEIVAEFEDGDDVAEDEIGSDDGVDEEAAVPVLTAIPTGGALSAPRGRDALTGMLDALAFEEALIHEDAREQRYRRSATVIVFELDGLAKLVDRLGSDPGDRIEAALGDTITRLARRADYVARLERGRYAVLLPETDEVAAINYVERIRRACDLWLESGAIAMRLAIGWASTGGDASLDGALRTATDRMRIELRRNSRLVGDATDMPGNEDASGL